MAGTLWQIRWIGIGIYWTLLFVATHVPLPAGALQNGQDKAAHFIAYGLLAFGLRVALSEFGKRAHLLSVGALLAFGAFDEITQMIVGRHCSIYDWIADAIGVGFGMLIGKISVILWNRYASPWLDHTPILQPANVN